MLRVMSFFLRIVYADAFALLVVVHNLNDAVDAQPDPTDREHQRADLRHTVD